MREYDVVEAASVANDSATYLLTISSLKERIRMLVPFCMSQGNLWYSHVELVEPLSLNMSWCGFSTVSSVSMPMHVTVHEVYLANCRTNLNDF